MTTSAGTNGLWEQQAEMSERQIELAGEIMGLLREYREEVKKREKPGPFIWIENHETGEFLAYTLGEARALMKRALETI